MTLLLPNFSQIVIVAAPGDELSFEASVDRPAQAQVKGSEENELLTEFRLKAYNRAETQVRADAEAFIRKHPATLAALAVYELLGGHAMFAVLQLAGGALLLAAGKGEQTAVPCQARGIPYVDAEAAVRMLRGLCQAADVCVSDLALLDKDAGMAHLTGTADDAMLDLLTALMEAKASGRSELAMRSLSQAEQYLHALGIELIAYDAAHAQLFDVLPTMGEARTIRPAMMKDGKVLRRGVAALGTERSVGA